MDIVAREDLSFPQSLPDFQRIFSDNTACAAYLEKARWSDGFRSPAHGAGLSASRSASRRALAFCAGEPVAKTLA